MKDEEIMTKALLSDSELETYIKSLSESELEASRIALRRILDKFEAADRTAAIASITSTTVAKALTGHGWSSVPCIGNYGRFGKVINHFTGFMCQVQVPISEPNKENHAAAMAVVVQLFSEVEGLEPDAAVNVLLNGFSREDYENKVGFIDEDN